jgi:hypothetical protein
MIINLPKKIIFVDRFDLQNGFYCPECGKFYLPNGTGPTNRRLLSRILKGLPSELMVGGIPPRLHDTAYNLCPTGWTVAYQISDGTVVEIKNKAQADYRYYLEMLDAHKDSKGLAKILLKVIAKRNYWAVKYDGKKSYKHCH